MLGRSSSEVATIAKSDSLDGTIEVDITGRIAPTNDAHTASLISLILTRNL